MMPINYHCQVGGCEAGTEYEYRVKSTENVTGKAVLKTVPSTENVTEPDMLLSRFLLVGRSSGDSLWDSLLP